MRSYLNIPSIIVFAVLLLALPMCKQNPSEPQFKGDIVVSVVPNIGTIHTTFEFRVHIVVNGDTAEAQGYRARWDWDGDKDYETPWLDSLTAQHLYGVLGKKMPEVQIEAPTGGTSLSSTPVYVQDLVPIWTGNPNEPNQEPDWSRDGSNRIAFVIRNPGVNSLFPRICVLQYPGGTITFVTPDSTFCYSPKWSFDGKKIAYTNGGGLAILDLITGLRTNFPYTFDQHPQWSPNGRYIAYGNSLYDLTDTSTSEIPFNTWPGTAWSPDGSKLAVLNPGELTIVKFPGFDQIHKQQVPRDIYGIEWSANGRWISLGGPNDWRKNFYILNLETNKVYSWRPDGLGGEGDASWSQDGTLIAFSTRVGGGYSIWAIRFPEDLY